MSADKIQFCFWNRKGTKTKTWGTKSFRGPQRKQGMAALFGGGTPAPAAACEETYGLFPCSTSLGGTIILIFVYGQALLVGERKLAAPGR